MQILYDYYIIKRQTKYQNINVYNFKSKVSLNNLNRNLQKRQPMKMQRNNQQATPSVYFNFDYSNQKTNQKSLQIQGDGQFVPYDYSCSNIKVQESYPKKFNQIKQPSLFQDHINCEFVTPPQYSKNRNIVLSTPSNDKYQQKNNQIGENKNTLNLEQNCVKLDTQQFFDQFDKNFVINFGEGDVQNSPTKNQSRLQFRKTFQSCPAVNTNHNKQTIGSKIESFISQPLGRRTSRMPDSNQNQQDLQIINIQIKKEVRNELRKIDVQKEKQNQPPPQQLQLIKKKSSKINCEIRKRIVLKNNQKLINKLNSNKLLNINQNKSSLIKRQNLLIVTSSNWDRWTDFPKDKKQVCSSTAQNGTSLSTQPIKRSQKQKSIKKTQSNIFSSRSIFKQTLRSTTLDNWKKKYIHHKNQNHKIKTIHNFSQNPNSNNIFQKPFSLLR